MHLADIIRDGKLNEQIRRRDFRDRQTASFRLRHVSCNSGPALARSELRESSHGGPVIAILARVEAGTDHLTRFLQRPVVAWAVAGLCLIAVVIHRTGADPDLFARIAVGRIVELTGSVAPTDPFAFTVRKALWVDHEWLSGVIFYHLAKWGGDQALFGFKVAIMLLSLAILSCAQRRQTSEPAASLLWLPLTAFPALYVWTSTVRSQVFTYLFLPVFLWVIVSYREDHDWRKLLIVPVVMLVWANVHGGFVVGLGLLGIFAVVGLRDGWRFALPLWGAVAVSTAVTLINPYGFDYWVYLAGALTMARPLISEWQSLDPTSPAGFIFLSYLAAYVLGTLQSERRMPLESFAMIAVSCLFTVRSLRLAAVFFMLLTVYGTDGFAALLKLATRRVGQFSNVLRRVLTGYALVGVAMLAWMALSFALQFNDFKLKLSRYPVESLEWLQEHRSGGDLLVDFNYGSYALWRLYPRFKVSIDGRYEEVYPEETFNDALAALDPAAASHEAALRRIDPDYVLLSHRSDDFAGAEPFGAEWTVIYRDDAFLLLEGVGATENESRVLNVRRPLWEPGF